MKYDVVVFGGCSLDQTFYETKEKKYNDSPDVVSPGGKGSNQAVAAAKAGAKTAMISRVGNDSIGDKIIDNLRTFNIDTHCVEVEDGLANDYSNIYINLDDKDNNIERFSGAINSFTPDMIERYKDVILSSRIVVCQLKVPKEVTIELINFCHKHNKTLILTPCRPEKLSLKDESNLELIDKISYITCNKKECETIFGTDNIEECVSRYPNKLIVTLGKDGLMYHDGTKVVHMPAIKVDVVDTTGAGDTLCGNLSAFLSQGMNLKSALRKAMYAATMKLTQKSAQAGMPYLADLEAFIAERRSKTAKYYEKLREDLLATKKAILNTKKRITALREKTAAILATDTYVAINNYLEEFRAQSKNYTPSRNLVV